MPNPFDKKMIDALSLEIGRQVGRFKGDKALLILHLKNHAIIRNITTDEEFDKLVTGIWNFVEEFLNKSGIPNKIIQSLPYHFAILDLSKCKNKIPKIIRELNASLATFSYAQIVVSYGAVQDQNHQELITDLINTVESFSGFSGFVEFDRRITETLKAEYSLLGNLKSSIKMKLARFAYQPIINCITGETEYYECLLRIPNHAEELVSAGPSILLAEKYGLINIVDVAVIEMAANELRSAKDLKLSVNVSNIGILDSRLLEKVAVELNDPAVASRLVIEITETSVNQDFKKISDFVSTMRELGCKIAIDDFGAGASSFSQLKNIKFDILKIDGSLIRGITANSYNKFLVETLVKIAETAGAVTVAEFVEDGAIAKFLMDSKVNFMQGNFFSPARNFRTWSKK